MTYLCSGQPDNYGRNTQNIPHRFLKFNRKGKQAVSWGNYQLAAFLVGTGFCYKRDHGDGSHVAGHGDGSHDSPLDDTTNPNLRLRFVSFAKYLMIDSPEIIINHPFALTSDNIPR